MRQKIAFVLALSLIALAPYADAQTSCPCIALSHTWLATPCESWNCAASALVLANGDPSVMAMPTNSDRYKWVILKRVVTGSVAVSPDAPMLVEQFSSMTEGSARFMALDQNVRPLLVTATDGNTLVIFLREGEKRGRAVTH